MNKLAFAALLIGCSSAQVEPCSQEDFRYGPLAAIQAECAQKRATACPDASAEERCPQVDDECDARIEARCSGAKK